MTEADTKGHILYGSLYIKRPRWANTERSKLVVTRSWELGKQGVTANMYKVLSGVMEILDTGDGCSSVNY